MKTIGIDIGTTTICLVVYEEESKTVVDGGRGRGHAGTCGF